MNAASLLIALWQGGHLRTLDHALAQSLRRLDRDTPDGVLAAAALASLAVSKGHAGLLLSQPQVLLDADADIAWPDPHDWQAQLATSRWISTPPHASAESDPRAPLVLEHGPGQPGLLYLRRYREYERHLALNLQRIAMQRPSAGDLPALAPLFARLFPPAPFPTLPPQAGEGLKRGAAARMERKAANNPTLPLFAEESSEPPTGESLPLFTGESARRAEGDASSTEPSPEADANPSLPPFTGEGARRAEGDASSTEPPSEADANPSLPPFTGEGARRADGGASSTESSPEADANPSLPPFTGEGARRAEGDASSTEPSPEADANPSLPPFTGEGARRADGGASSAVNHQAQAAALALRHALLLVTGGPGTGKTTTTARLLVLLAAQARQAGRAPPRIALAAPTGRAAERMAESVRGTVQSLAAAGVDADLLAALPSTGTTLHRLLGTLPDSPRFRHDADNPLPFDVVVVDEASMIDLPLMAKLVDAVADGTRLVLLGDPDQLPSVEAGDVLAAILSAAGEGDRLAADDAEALRPLLGHADPDHGPGAGGAAAFAGIRVHLQRGWRQSESLQLSPLAAAVREGDADGALARLRGGALSNVHFHEDLADPLQSHRDPLLAHWRALAAAASPAEALARSNRLRILTAVREGPQGARTLNARIERLLLESGGAGLPRAGHGHFHGQLLIVTENSYRHRLFNGDIGICLRDEQAALVAWFPGEDPAQPRGFHPATLPAHESAFAMTVHKAQGSEFDTVWLLLPARGNRVLSRELVYTGITRARRELHVAGSEAVIREALSRHAARWSGLGWRLAGID